MIFRAWMNQCIIAQRRRPSEGPCKHALSSSSSRIFSSKTHLHKSIKWLYLRQSWLWIISYCFRGWDFGKRTVLSWKIHTIKKSICCLELLRFWGSYNCFKKTTHWLSQWLSQQRLLSFSMFNLCSGINLCLLNY